FPDRPQTTGEEVANSVTHGLGALGALAAAPLLIAAAWRAGDALNVTAAAVFAATLLLLYLGSTLYHALPHGPAKRLFKRLDHCAIYLLIAGTYTPFAFGVLRGAWGWTLFGLVWGLALFGVLLKLGGALDRPRLSTALYVVMGWLALIAAVPLWQGLSAWTLAWLLAGGIAYSAGVAFFVSDDRVRYHH
ncbi:MAG: hemolysin III family protein, partial [Caldilinea sp.]|nr:hemolysin III family protein [Caldilinea sp.]